MNVQSPRRPISAAAGCGIAAGFAFVLFVMALFVFGLIASSRTESTPEPPPSGAAPIAAAKPAQWALVGTVKGRSMKSTQRFAVGPEWQIAWATQPGESGDGNFIIRIHGDGESDGRLIANVIGASRDQSYHYDPGTYYLEIITTQPYTIMIWDKQ